MTHWKGCYTCRDYATWRRRVLAQPLADKARREGRDVIEVTEEYMAGAHQRHIGGLPLRPGGPTRVTDPFAGRTVATYALLGSKLTEEG